METTTAGVDMAKKQMGRPKSALTYASMVRMEASLAKKGRSVADDRGISFAAYVDELVRERIDADFREMVKKYDEKK